MLFGFGFDTASSIALLAVTALAKKNSNGQGTIAQSNIIVLPLLFTAGMTLVDSIDSCIMLYSYSGFPERGWNLFEKPLPQDLSRDINAPPTLSPAIGPEQLDSTSNPGNSSLEIEVILPRSTSPDSPPSSDNKAPFSEAHSIHLAEQGTPENLVHQRMKGKQHTMSSLSIILTLISILV